MQRRSSAASCANSAEDTARRDKSSGIFRRVEVAEEPTQKHKLKVKGSVRPGRLTENPAGFKLAGEIALACSPPGVQAAFLICLIFAQRAFCAREILRRPAAESTRLARCGPPALAPGPRVSFSRTEIASPSFWTWFCASRRSSRSRTIALAMFVIKYPLG
jgi:hypothetical protein